MQADFKEAIGFVCRWSLLGLVGLAGAVLAVMVLDRSAAAAGIGGTCLIVPDAVAQAGKPVQVWAFHSARGNERTALALYGPAGGERKRGVAYGSRVYLSLPAEAPGLDTIETVGVPYGPLAYQRIESLLVTVKPGKRAFLIDARLAIAQEDPTFFSCLAALGRAGDVASFYLGQPTEYTAVRDAIRELPGGVPAIYLAERKSLVEPWSGSGRMAIGAFKRAGAARIDLITDDPELAGRTVAFAAGFRAGTVRIHVVGLGGPDEQPDSPIAYHADWQAVGESLLSESMGS